MEKRYTLLRPVRGGNEYYRIEDQDSEMNVASFHKGMHRAEEHAKACLMRLNGEIHPLPDVVAPHVDDARAADQPFFFTEPVPGGYAWWNVGRLKGGEYPNFKMADFFRGMPRAAHEARNLCVALNEAA